MRALPRCRIGVPFQLCVLQPSFLFHPPRPFLLGFALFFPSQLACSSNRAFSWQQQQQQQACLALLQEEKKLNLNLFFGLVIHPKESNGLTESREKRALRCRSLFGRTQPNPTMLFRNSQPAIQKRNALMPSPVAPYLPLWMARC